MSLRGDWKLQLVRFVEMHNHKAVITAKLTIALAGSGVKKTASPLNWYPQKNLMVSVAPPPSFDFSRF